VADSRSELAHACKLALGRLVGQDAGYDDGCTIVGTHCWRCSQRSLERKSSLALHVDASFEVAEMISRMSVSIMRIDLVLIIVWVTPYTATSKQ
jgi:hypothetical protein